MKTTNINIKYIILITDSLNSTSKTVGLDLFVHSKQAYFLDHSCGFDYKIEFWNCPSNTKWSLHQLVYNNITNTGVAVRIHLVTSISTLCFTNILLCLDA